MYLHYPITSWRGALLVWGATLPLTLIRKGIFSSCLYVLKPTVYTLKLCKKQSTYKLLRFENLIHHILLVSVLLSRSYIYVSFSNFRFILTLFICYIKVPLAWMFIVSYSLWFYLLVFNSKWLSCTSCFYLFLYDLLSLSPLSCIYVSFSVMFMYELHFILVYLHSINCHICI